MKMAVKQKELELTVVSCVLKDRANKNRVG